MAQVVVEMTSDEAKLWRGMQRVIEQQDKVDKKNKDIEKSSKDAGKGQESAFGSRALSGLANYAMGALSVGAAVGKIAEAMMAAKQAAAQLAQAQSAAAANVGALAQLAWRDPQQYRKIVGEAKKSYGEGAGASMAEAAQTQFTVESAGFGSERKLIAAMQASGLVADPKQMVDAAAAVSAAFGQDRTGNFERVVSKALGASEGAPSYAQEIMAAVAKSGPAAKALGIGDVETYAAIPTVAKVTGSASEGGTAISSLMSQIEKGMAEGKVAKEASLQGYVGQIGSRVDAGEGIREILGDSKEAILAFRLLRENAEAFQKNIANVLEAEEKNALRQGIEMAGTILPEQRAAVASRRAAAANVLAGEELGVTSNRWQTLEETRSARYRETGMPEWINQLQKTVLHMQSWMIGEELSIKMQTSGSGAGLVNQVVGSLQASAENLRRATESHSDRQRQRASTAQVAE